MGGITLEDLSESRAYQEIFGLGEARGEEQLMRLLLDTQVMLWWLLAVSGQHLGAGHQAPPGHGG